MKTKSTAQKVAAAMTLLAALGVLTFGGWAVARPAAPAPAASSSAPSPAAPPAPMPRADTNANTYDITMAPAPPAVPPAPFIQPAPVAANAMEEHTQGKIVGEFHADNLDLKTALALFAKQNDLNIVPDNDIAGTVTLDVHNLPLTQMMRALLEAGDCSWQEDNGLIRVRNTETRTFVVDYLRLQRTGMGNSSANLNSATAGNNNSGIGGGGGSGSGSGGGGNSSGSGNGTGGGNSSSSTSVNLTGKNDIDFWTELRDELGFILTDAGKHSLAINKTAGIIEVSDRPSVLKRVEHYLNSTEHNINRQVDIEAKIYDVTLNDQFQFGIDWNVVAQYYEGSTFGVLGGIGVSTLPTAIGSSPSQSPTLSMLFTNFTIFDKNNPKNWVPVNDNAAVQALKTQGNVEVLAKPRIRTLNNQTALIKVGQELPFFSQTIINNQSAGGNQTSSGDIITTITVGTILSITPQISEDGMIAMDITPSLSSLVTTLHSPSGTATAPVLDTKQASTLVRVRNGATVVMGGLIQTEKDDNDNKVPLLGDIPWLGRLFTGTYHNKVKKELVIFLTPRIVEASENSVSSPDVRFTMPTDPTAKPQKSR